LQPAFDNFFNSLPDDERGVVDIGAGTGVSYYLVKGTGYNFTKYYYIEPFKKMIDQFEDKNNSKIIIIDDYFESEKSINLIKGDRDKKIFMMCGAFRTLDNVNKTLDVLSSSMQKGDKLFLPIEPNNEYFGKYYKFIAPYFFSIAVYKKLKKLLLTIIRFKNQDKSKEVINDNHPLDKSLQYLRNTGVVNNKFTTTILYAIVYYNNFFCWRSIDIPDQYNEGFFTIDQVAEGLSCEINVLYTRIYLYGLGLTENSWTEKVLHKIFPNSGSSFTAVLTKL